jgi:hypothetical protein
MNLIHYNLDILQDVTYIYQILKAFKEELQIVSMPQNK